MKAIERCIKLYSNPAFSILERIVCGEGSLRWLRYKSPIDFQYPRTDRVR